MEDYQKFLKATLFSEKKIISYRLLSRRLKVHVNQAKEMLYDFHCTENDRKPNCVHATYVITGFRRPPPTKSEEACGEGDQDTEMQCGPFDSSFPGVPPPKGEEASDEGGQDTEMQCGPLDSSFSGAPPAKGEEASDEGEDDQGTEVQCGLFDSSFPGAQSTATAEEGKKKIRVIELCQEEDLDVIKTEFEEVLSIHVYSLEPVLLKDLSTLTGCSVEILEISQEEDMLKMGATYGTIMNPSAMRTDSRAPPPPALVSRKSTLSIQAKNNEVIPAKEPKLETKDAKPKEATKADEKEKKPAAKASTIPAKKAVHTKLKRGQSNLFASWGSTPKKPAESASESNSAAHSPKAEEEPDVKMESDDDDDDDDEVEEEPSQPACNHAEDLKKKKEREDELRRMMDDEDEDEDVKMEEDEPPAKAAGINASPEAEEPSRSTADVTSAGGRRRGKRKAMKKVQSRDEEGYLVTSTEAVWESFSEDEPEPLPKPKPKVAVKGKKGAMTGQGNITSFFAKK